MAKQKLFSRRSQAPSRIDTLDERLKLNRGTGVSFAQDTGAQPGYILPFGKTIRNQTGAEAAPTFQQRQVDIQAPQYQPPQVDQVDYNVQPEPTQGASLNQFLQEFGQSIYAPEQMGSPSSDYLEALYQATGTPYGVASLPDGSIKLNTGAIQQPGQEPVPVASAMNGGVRMSDGSIRQLAPELANRLRGLEGLTQGLFGQNLDVTQQFGNYNPSLEPGSGYNMGTDLRTKNLSQPGIFPVDAKVIQVTQDDGTRWGDTSGHQGYGNSILIELSTGEKLRLSHLAQLPQISPDGTLKAGTAIIPGATGNVTGEHLDYEYYAPGQNTPSDPSQFSGFSNPQQFLPASQPQSQPIQNVASQMPQPQQMSSQIPQQPQQQPQNTQPLAVQAVGNLASKAVAPIQKAGQIAGGAIDTNQALNRATNGLGVGLSETFQGNLPGAGKELAQTIDRLNPTGTFDTGLSELLSGDTQKAQQNFNDARQRVMARLNRAPGELANTIAPSAYAANGNEQTVPETLAQNIQGAGQSISQYLGEKTKPISDAATTALQAAGSGVQQLQRFFSNISPGAATRPSVSDISGKRDIGDSPRGTNLLGVTPSQQQQQTTQKNDIRDPFFKAGGATEFARFLQPGAAETGALGIDTFTPEFYQNQNNVTSAFAGTNLLPQAQGKYDAYVAEEARKAAEREYLRTVSLADYLAMGKTPAQWYAETGRQGELDAMGGPDSSGVKQAVDQARGGSSVSRNIQQGSQTGQGTQTVTYNNGRTVQAPSNTNLRADSGGNVQAVQNWSGNIPGSNLPYNLDTPTKSPSAQLAQPQQPQPNQPSLFSRITQNIAKLFRK